MICPRCKNKDTAFFHTDTFGCYCRKCVNFGRINSDHTLKKVSVPKIKSNVHYELDYPLSSNQLSIAIQTIDALKKNQDVLINACCGSGKTEILLPVIEFALNQNKTIAIAIPRRQVVLELQQRLASIFKELDVIAVCGEHTRKIKGELIICTTHQLFRYYKSFNYLVIDEYDAFPFKNNDVLHQIAKNSYTDHLIALTATIDDQIDIHQFKVLQLFERYHLRKIPIPKLIILPEIFQFLYLLYFIRKYAHLTILIFVATIRFADQLHQFLSKLYPCFKLTSKSFDKETILHSLHQSKLRILITTTIMERGITIADACVIVMQSDHHVFNCSSLIQIAGRVDRKPQSFNAPVIFLAKTVTSHIKQCINQLKTMNRENNNG